MTIFGVLRVRNEQRWIEQVIRSIQPVCSRIFVFDDHSTDKTPDICSAMKDVTVYRSTFVRLDESRDKTFLLKQVMGTIHPQHLNPPDPKSPFWALAIDGDEVLDPRGLENLTTALQRAQNHVFRLQVKYLWDSDLSNLTPGNMQVRTDGVYSHFTRPSVFRLMDSSFTYMTTNYGGNFHCSSIPQQLLHLHSPTIDAPILHLGYNYREDRIRKRSWYCQMDPNNAFEDNYRHCVQGDVPEVPASAVLRHAGPLKLEMM